MKIARYNPKKENEAHHFLIKKISYGNLGHELCMPVALQRSMKPFNVLITHKYKSLAQKKKTTKTTRMEITHY
jgi:hypothetical protein